MSSLQYCFSRRK